MTVITTVMAGISVCQIVPIEAEESTYTASVEEDTGTLQVEASAPDDVLPENAQLVVSPIVNDGTNSLYEDTLNKLNEQASKDKKVIDAFCAYDIQFEDNDAGVEPDDGFVSVSMKWDTALKPDGVQEDDKVSIIHLTSDDKIENLTDETDTDKNHGTVKMDDNDPEAVAEASIISDSFSVYALVWQRDDISSVNVHYIDESGNEIADTNTTDITQETGTDTLVQAIDGYTYAYASIDNTNVQSVNIDNGRLYFYDGTNWNQASSDDVYLTYTVIPAEEVTEPESTPTSEVTEQPEETEAPVTPETTPEPEQNTDKQLTGSTTDGKYNVTVTYGDDAGLPEGTSLSVKQIDEDNEEYADAKKAVSTATGVDTDDLGMTALDITLLDKDGNKVEPEDNSKVKVSITAEDLPDSVNSVDIHHITENENSSSDTGLLSKIAGLFKSNDKDTAETVKKNVTVTNGQAVTDFEVSSFSTFTITWSTSNGTSTSTFANVQIHYVDDKGMTIEDPTSVPASSLGDGTTGESNIVDLRKWAYNDDNTSRVTGYVYSKALIGANVGSSKAKEITGLKASATEESRQVDVADTTGEGTHKETKTVKVYKLYYTTDETVNANSKWTQYVDSSSGEGSNNANVYLSFKLTAQTVFVHFVDEDGNILLNPVTKYADDISADGQNVSDWASTIPNYKYSGFAHLSQVGWMGPAFNMVRKVQQGADYTIQYKTKDDESEEWKDVPVEDIYLIYQPETISVPVKLHYTDLAGVALKDEAGNEITRTVDAATWKDTADLVSLYTVNTPTGCADFSKTNLNANDNSNAINSANEIVIAAANQDSSDNRASLDRAITGKKMRYMKYVAPVEEGGQATLQYSNDNNTWYNVTSADSGTVDIYLMYRPELRIHYVDQFGNQVKATDATRPISYDVRNIASVSNRYGFSNVDRTVNSLNKSRIYLKENDRDGNAVSMVASLDSFSVAWNFIKGTGWQTQIRTADNTYQYVNGLVQDVYFEYAQANHNVNVHYIDENGNAITDQDTAISLSATRTLTIGNTTSDSDLNKTISGYTETNTAYFGGKDTDHGGTKVSSITYTKTDNNGWTYALNEGTDAINATATSTNLYIVYSKNPTITIHRVDSDGNKVADDVTQTLDSTPTTINISDNNTKLDVTGYSRQSTAYLNGMDTNNGAVAITSITYTRGEDGKWSNSFVKEGDSDGTSGSFQNEIWVVYKSTNPTITVHYIDTDGKLISVDTKPAIVSGNGLTIDASSYATFVGYQATGKGYFNYSDNSSKGTEFSSIKFVLGNNGDWTNTYETSSNNSEQSIYGEIKEVRIEYERNISSDDAPMIIHHVDENGNPIAAPTSPNNTGKSTLYSNWNGYTFYNDKNWNNRSNTDSKAYFVNVSGYTIDAEYIGVIRDANKVPKGDQIQYKYSNGKWQTGYGTGRGSNTAEVFDANGQSGYFTDIYHVYSKNGETGGKTFNVYYKYLDANGNAQNATVTENNSSVTPPVTFTLRKSDGIKPLVFDPATYGDYVKDLIKNKTVTRAATAEELAAGSGSTIPLTYASTRVGSPDGPAVTSVEIDDNGLARYTAESNVSLSVTSASNRWSYSADTGRTLTIRKNSITGELTIEDSQHDTLTLNLTENTSDGTTTGFPLYTATYSGDSGTTTYSAYQVGDPGYWELKVEESYAIDNTDLYQIYQKDDPENGSIWINDELKYSGYYVARISDTAQQNLYGKKDITYTWYRVTADADGSNPTTTLVTRKQTGDHWNIPFDVSERKWLDVEADEGDDVWTAANKISYYVELSYTDSGGNTKTLRSDPIEVDYYGQLENGDFERPSTNPADESKGTYVAPIHWNDYSNQGYKDAGGVWQTTGTKVSSDGGKDYQTDIEVINTAKNPSQDYKSYYFANEQSFQAASGDQFVELNCEAAGALYQDVITHPNQKLNYSLSHRARGNPGVNGTTPEYDTMYLVIMPTKLAMVSGANGTELTKQSDLKKFIDAHGGYDTNRATSVGQRITWQDDVNGILIEKIDSNDQFWHTVSVLNGYTAKSGLTRFFFVAGPTAYGNEYGEHVDEATHGNFIDNVSFSQRLPKPTGFNMTVNKTFSGLTEEQIASLATNASQLVSEGKITATAANPFKFTITDSHQPSESGQEVAANSSLNGAILQFTADKAANGQWVFTPTAKASDADDAASLLTDGLGNSAYTSDYSNGSITMTWQFQDEALDAAAADQTFKYTVAETGDVIAGYALTSTASTTVNNGTATDGNSASIEKGTDAVYNFTNSYRDSAQDEIIVKKTFYGVTPSTVDAMMSGTSTSRYSIDVSTGEGDDKKTVRLTGVEGDQAPGVSLTVNRGSDTPLVLEEGDDGSTTYTWTISGYGSGNYSVVENNYTTTKNTFEKATLNTTEMTTSSTTIGSGTSEVTVPTASGTATVNAATGMSYSNYSGPTAVSDNSVSIGDNNLIIISYKDGGTDKYLVWSKDTLLSREQAAIYNQINTKFNTNTAGSTNTTFVSGDNRGEVTIGSSGDGASATIENGAIALKDGTNVKWTSSQAYTATYSIQPDINVVNYYSTNAKIQKVSKSTDGGTLSGAEFLLKNAGNKYLKVSSTTNEGNTTTKNDWVEASADATKFTTESDGVAVIGSLEPGDYYLTENKAPDGYNRLRADIHFRIKENRTVTLIDKDGNEAYALKADGSKAEVADVTNPNDDTYVTIEFIDPYYTLNVANSPGSILPITGGKGIALFTMMGMLLIAIAGVLYAKKKVNQNIKNLQ